MADLLAIQPLGRNRATPRLWIESQRLDRLGFGPGVALMIDSHPDRLVLRSSLLGENHVSSRVTPHGRRPIFDLENRSLLSGLSEYSAVKIIASFERIEICPSVRAAAIQRSRRLAAPLRVLEAFAGGGSMTAALDGNPAYRTVAGIEIDPNFADEWETKHQSASLIQADIRLLHSSEMPEFDVLIGGVPCTSHSNLGRAKMGLAQRPEVGDSGDRSLK